jgi:hypothetical protein
MACWFLPDDPDSEDIAWLLVGGVVLLAMFVAGLRESRSDRGYTRYRRVVAIGSAP